MAAIAQIFWGNLCWGKNVWKICNIQKYLKDAERTFYINNCLHILFWTELLFTEHYCAPDALSLTDFSNIKFKFGEDLNEYYHSKNKVGHILGVDQHFILGITEGLPLEMKQLVGTSALTGIN